MTQVSGKAGLRRQWLGFLALAVLGFLIYYVFIGAIRPVDLDVFLRAGRAVAHGHNPYSSVHSETIRTNAAFVYPLAVAWWFAPLSALGGAAHLTYAIASLVAIVLACWLARPTEPLVAALVLLSSCAVIGLQDGTVNPWLLLGLVMAWRWRDRPLLTGAVVAILIVGKLFLWPVIGWLLITRRYRAGGVAVLLTGATLMAGWFFGPLGLSSYAAMLHVLSGIEVPHASSLSGLLVHWHASLSFATTLATVLAVALLGGFGYWAHRHPAQPGNDMLSFGTAVVAALLASPIVWHHYYLLLAVPLLVATQSRWPFVALSLASWVAAAPHVTSSERVVEGYFLGVGGVVLIALATTISSCRRPSPPGPAYRLRRHAGRVIRPVAIAASLTVLLVVATSAWENVSVGVAWGALVTLVELVGVQTFLWSRIPVTVVADR